MQAHLFLQFLLRVFFLVNLWSESPSSSPRMRVRYDILGCVYPPQSISSDILPAVNSVVLIYSMCQSHQNRLSALTVRFLKSMNVSPKYNIRQKGEPKPAFSLKSLTDFFSCCAVIVCTL